MLQRIKVRNYAIIDDLTIDFSPNLNIITGETGAGKSILLGALGLILGNRADSKTFFNTSEKCIIEAEFEIGNYDIQEWFEENDLDYDPHTLIRREIQPAGKNRVFINDTPVSLQQLQELSQKLVDIHQQFSLYDIQKPSYQLELFDAFCGNKKLIKTYRKHFKDHLSVLKKLKLLEEEKSRSLAEADYINFQLDELNSVPYSSMNQETMEEELNMIEHAGAIKATAGAAYGALEDSEDSILTALDLIIARFHPLAGISTGLKEISDRLYSSKLELDEIARDISHLAENTEIDEERSQQIRESLDLLYKLQSKHQVSDVAGLISLKDNLEARLHNYEALDNDIASVTLEAKALENKLFEQAAVLTENRKGGMQSFTDNLHELLSALGMPHARFTIDIATGQTLTASGMDDVQFLFAANIGSDPAPIKDVASGGEISRLTLAIKSMVAAVIPLPSLVFDEIDTGLGGEIALKMSLILQEMAKDHQLVAITHSPQLASKAHKHLFVFKEIHSGKTYTQIKELSLEERIENIAIMLSTKPPTKAAIENAKELIAQE